MYWQQQRDNQIAAKQAHMAAILAERHQGALNRANLKPVLPYDDARYTSLQLELFATNPVDFDYIENRLKALPRQRQREHFRKLYLNAYRAVPDDGSIAFKLGNKQRRAANHFLRDVLDVRLQQVFAQYGIDVAYLQAFLDEPKWLADLKAELADEAALRDLVQKGDPHANHFMTVPTAAELDEQHRYLQNLGFKFKQRATKQIEKSKLPFYLIGESKLKQIAAQLADEFRRYQLNYAQTLIERSPVKLNAEEMKACFFNLYKKCGQISLSFGFRLPHWEKIDANKRIKGEHVDSTLIRLTCEKWWFKQMRSVQSRMVEHIAIACGEVRKKVSSYISFAGLNQWIQQQRKNYDYLKAMILENVDDPTEQIELFDTFLKSSSYPAIRRIELLNRWRGIEEWADHNDYQALFLTLTAPSAYHAVLSQSGKNNPKWNGKNPKQTHAYLNGVW